MMSSSQDREPSIDVVFPISDMWLLPYLRNACAGVLAQEYRRELIGITISYYHAPDNTEDIGELGALCLELDAQLVCQRWQNSQFSRGQAINIGIRCGCREIVACLDADVVIHPRTFKHAKSFLNDGTPAAINVARTDLRPDAELFEQRDPKQWQAVVQKSPWRRDGVGNILIPRALIETMRGYDERFYGWGGGDTELDKRLREHGIDLVFLHDHGGPTALHQWHRLTPTRESEFTARNRNLLARPSGFVQNPGGWGGVADSKMSNNLIV